MEKQIKYSLLVLLLTFSICPMPAQEASIIRTGLIKTQMTITPSYMFGAKQGYFYLHGGWEAYLSAKLSLAGEGYYFLGNLSTDKQIFDHNHNLFFGTSWHFSKNNNDLFVGIQPGISLTKLNAQDNNLTKTHFGVNPIFSTVMGYNFFVYKFFHFFIQTRILLGGHHYDIPQNLAEVRLSAGLGFNLNTMKANLAKKK